MLTTFRYYSAKHVTKHVKQLTILTKLQFCYIIYMYKTILNIYLICTVKKSSPLTQVRTVSNFPPIGGRYYSWYSDPGHLETVQTKLLSDLNSWRSTFGK